MEPLMRSLSENDFLEFPAMCKTTMAAFIVETVVPLLLHTNDAFTVEILTVDIGWNEK